MVTPQDFGILFNKKSNFFFQKSANEVPANSSFYFTPRSLRGDLRNENYYNADFRKYFKNKYSLEKNFEKADF